MTTTFAFGEVQESDAPAIRHAVADATPGRWARAFCPAKTLVWVHVVAGDVMPFPGPLGGDMACPECVALVASARDAAAGDDDGAKPPRTRRDWFRWRP